MSVKSSSLPTLCYAYVVDEHSRRSLHPTFISILTLQMKSDFLTNFLSCFNGNFTFFHQQNYPKIKLFKKTQSAKTNYKLCVSKVIKKCLRRFQSLLSALNLQSHWKFINNQPNNVFVWFVTLLRRLLLVRTPWRMSIRFNRHFFLWKREKIKSDIVQGETSKVH